METELEELMRKAEAADPQWRIECRDPIASHGRSALVAIARWAADARFAYLVPRIVKASIRYGVSTSEAIEALEAALDVAPTPWDEGQVLAVLGELAPRKWGTQGSNRDTRFAQYLQDRAPLYLTAWTKGIWHRIADEVRLTDGSRRFLIACHRWNSEGYVTSGGRALRDEVDDRELCDNCRRAERAWPLPRGAWATVVAPWRDESDRLHARSREAWHLVKYGGLIDAVGLGAVLMTECGLWVEAARLKGRGRLAEPAGKTCLQCTRFALGRAAEGDTLDEDGAAASG